MDFLNFLSDPSWLNAVANGIQAGGQITSAREQREFGEESRAAAEYQAAQLRDRGNAAQAEAQRQAALEDRNAKLVASRALAVAAASGGGASDPTVLNVIAGIAQEGAYRKSVALYQGDDRARVMRMQATARQIEGRSKQASADSIADSMILGAGTSLLRGVAQGASLYQRFGGGGPKPAEQLSPSWDDYA